ncbi:sensor histidine kinase [Streptomonospora nanhaiensis]|uniref:histidine kinase n=1 Tax=Streptomonospora nanhaiensis TaxID=1323731 RepID=A0A853BF44_9ACTN|nr:histidine kinase [Streptomonospora nanhaiensis]NYI93953.1 signal transduction histidine kinase [Streptomonospora nanhaiensis]
MEQQDGAARTWRERWWARRHRAADWTLAAMAYPWIALMVAVAPAGPLGGTAMQASGSMPRVLSMAALTFLVPAGVAALVLVRRTRPGLLMAASAALLLCVGDFGTPGLALFSYAAWNENRRSLAAWAVGLMGASIAQFSLASAVVPGAAVMLVLVFQAMPLTVGLWVGTRRELIANLHERAERLEREQHLLADQAITAERTRIAREMHDVVAHRVSLMVLHAGGLEVSAADERTVATAGLIRTTGREALAELRGILGVLREEPDAAAPTAPQPVLADLARLIGEWRRAGTPVDWRVSGTPAPLPAQTERTAYRTVQEALTNAGKHAPGGAVRVELEHRPGELAVTVDNEDPPDGPPADPPPGSGYGLAGLRERLALIGGTLAAGPRPGGGWRVRAVMPAGRAPESGEREPDKDSGAERATQR